MPQNKDTTVSNTSQKIQIIRAIDEDSRQLWLMLNGYNGGQSREQVTDLFISIVNRSSDGITRFDLTSATAYINTHLAKCSGTAPIDILACLARATKADQLSYFLFK